MTCAWPILASSRREWHRTNVIASGEDSWPDLQTPSGTLWWLESEIAVAEGYVEDDETSTQQGIIDYYREAAERLRAALKDQIPNLKWSWVEYIGTNLERTGEAFYRIAIEAHLHQLKDV